MMQKPLLGIALGLIIGIVVSWLCSLPIYLLICFSLLVVVLGGWFHYHYRKGLFVVFFLVGVGMGGIRFTLVDEANYSHIAPLVNKSSVTVLGEITSPPQMDGDRCAFDFTLQRVKYGTKWISVTEKIRVTLKLANAGEVVKAKELQRFDVFMTSLQLKSPPAPRNPGAFDYRTYLYRQGIHLLGEMEGLSYVHILKKSDHPFVYIDRLRETVAAQIEQIFPLYYAGTIRGMLLGEREQVDLQVLEDYSTLGIIHLLVIAGLHVGVLVATFYFFLLFIGLTREKTAVLILGILPIYAILTGAGAPVVRSCIMAMLALLAVILRRFKDTFSFLAVALIVQILWDPYQIFGAGLQLSFLITGALIVGVPSLVRKIQTPWRWLNQSIAVTLVAQIASFPLLIYYFHSFSILSWFVNLLAVPLFTTFIFPLSLLGLGVSSISLSLGEIIASFSMFFLWWVDQLSTFFLSFSWAHISWAEPSLLWIGCYFLVAIYSWMVCIGSFYAKRHLLLSSVLFISVLLYAHQVQNWWRDETSVTFLDVGQGDCAVIETRGGKVILIDGGGSPQFPRPGWQRRRHVFDVGKQVVVPYLNYRGIRQIDYLIITHGDADHIGGLQAVAEKLPVHRVIRNAHAPHTELEKKLMQTLRERGSHMVVPPRGLQWELEPGVKWHFLHPDPQHPLGDDVHTNDDSVVCLLQIYGKKVLMTGDIGVEAEHEILSHWNLFHIDLLKVAHHGSKYSTDEKWLNAISPQEAVISVGEKNRYGHPTPDVLERLAAHHVSVLRTDQLGAITYHFKPGKTVRTTMLSTNMPQNMLK